MKRKTETILKITLLLGFFVFAFVVYQAAQHNKIVKGFEDKSYLYCERDTDCTYYTPLNCINAKPINKDYKATILKLAESKNDLCGVIETKCQANECVIAFPHLAYVIFEL